MITSYSIGGRHKKWTKNIALHGFHRIFLLLPLKVGLISLINDYNMSFSCAVIQYIIHVCTNPNEKRCGPGTDVTDLLQCIWINHRFR